MADSLPEALRFPAGFLFGCATAAHQVEGGSVNDWSEFEARPGAIRGGDVSGAACDHWNRYRDDLRELADLGQNAHRFSVEWSRVEPLEGELDAAALRHYSDVVDACRENGLEPIVTLHHFSLPLWLSGRGGVLSPDAPRRFARYAAAVAEALGDRVTWWITLNEPSILVFFGYLYGLWPPGERSSLRAAAALRALVRIHSAGAAALRSVAARHARPARVSIAQHLHGMRPRDPASRLDRLGCRVPDLLTNRWFLLACRDGRLHPPLGAGERVPGAAGSIDYVGANYYSDDVVSFDLRAAAEGFGRRGIDPDLPRSAYGWTIDPDGLRRALVRVWEEFRLPVMVTENGVSDLDDELRPRFLVDHLAAVRRAMDEGVDVRGYLHWTAMDNFEWAEGYSQRFGLIAVDRTTQERRRKPSAEVYEAICRGRPLPAWLEGVAAGGTRPLVRPPHLDRGARSPGRAAAGGAGEPGGARQNGEVEPQEDAV